MAFSLLNLFAASGGSPINQPPSLVVFIIVDPMSSSGKAGDKSNLDRKVEPSLRFVNELIWRENIA